MILSSAKSLNLLCDRYSGKSFMQMRNKIGSNTVPWGTPDVTGTVLEDIPFTTTVCVRLTERLVSRVGCFLVFHNI